MKFKSDFLENYIQHAPLALAFERTLECRILSRQTFERPILDIGCGEGLFANILFDEPIETGVDPDKRELDRARDFGAYNELLECPGASIPKPDGTYRTIFSNSVAEHIPDLLPVLREANRLLAPGGRLFLTVPSDKFEQYSLISKTLGLFGLVDWQIRYRAFYNRFWRHYNVHTPEQWGAIVQSCGFEISELYAYAPQRVCLTNDILVPFSVPEWLTKKTLNKWTLFPKLRGVMLAPIAAIARPMLRGTERSESGGLVFIAARKR